MKLRQVITLFILAVLPFLLLGGCASTRMVSQINPEVAGRSFGKILVDGNFQSLEQRQLAEGQICAELTSLDTCECFKSAEVFFPGQEHSSIQITARLDTLGVDGILVVKPTASGIESIYIPQTTTTTASARAQGNTASSSVTTRTFGGFSVDELWANYEVTFYSRADGKVAWYAQASSDGGLSDEWGDLIRSLSFKTVEKLISDGIFPFALAKRTAACMQSAAQRAAESRSEIRLAAGVSLPSSPRFFANTSNSGLTMSGGIGYSPTSSLAFHAEIGYSKWSANLPGSLREFVPYQVSSASQQGGAMTMFSITAECNLYLISRPESISPYIVAGLGFSFHRQQEWIVRWVGVYGNHEERRASEYSASAFVGLFGIGVDIPISRGLSIYIEGKYASSMIANDPLDWLPIRLGLRLKM